MNWISSQNLNWESIKLRYLPILLILTIAAACGNSEPKINYYIVGLGHYKNNHNGKAMEAFKNAYEKNGNIKALYRMADIALKTGDLYNSENYLKKILKKDSKAERATLQLGILYKKQGKFNDAIPHLNHLLTSEKLKGEAINQLCDIYLKSDHIKEAQKLYLKLKKRDDRIEFLFLTYHLSAHSKNYLPHFNYLKNHASNYLLLNKMVDLFLSKGKLQQALDILVKLSEKFPNRVQTLQAIGEIYQQWGNYEKALTYFTKIDQVDSSNLINKLDFATTFLYMGDLKRAERYINEALAIRLESAEALLLSALVYYLKGDRAASEKILKTVYKNIPIARVESLRSNQLIDLYLTVVAFDRNPTSISRKKIDSLPMGKNSAILSIKLEKLNFIGEYKEVIKIYSDAQKWLKKSDHLYEQIFVAFLRLNQREEAAAIIKKISKEKQPVYQIWFNFFFDNRCPKMDQDQTPFKNNSIFVDIYSNCLVRAQKYKEAKLLLMNYVKNQKLDLSTLSYIRGKILSINRKLLKRQ